MFMHGFIANEMASFLINKTINKDDKSSDKISLMRSGFIFEILFLKKGDFLFEIIQWNGIFSKINFQNERSK